MRYMIKSLSDKITAIFIYLLLSVLCVAMFLAIDCLIEYHFYAGDGIQYSTREAMRVKTNEEFDIIEHYTVLKLAGEDVSDLFTKYAESRSNILFLVCDETGNTLLTNMDNPAAYDPQTAFEFTNEKPLNICDSSGNIVRGTVSVHVRKGLPAKDSYRLAINLIKTANVIKYPILFVLFFFVIAMILVLGMLMSGISQRSKNDQDPNAVPERFIDKIPFDLMIIIMAAIIAIVGLLMILTSVADIKQNNLVLWNALFMILSLVVASVTLLFSLSLATRIKYGHVYRNTLVFKLIAGIRKRAGKANDGYFKVRFISKVLITIGLIFCMEIAVTLVFLLQYKIHQNGPLSEFHFPYFAIFQLFVISLIGSLFFAMALNLYHLRVRSSNLAHGNLKDIGNESTILFGDFREISNDFENIKDDMIKAMEEKNKSAQLRNELIANISHDIKTPLTSIINYADILSSGEGTEEEVKSYLDVIGRQSQKLSDLLQNLIEVSKISAGQLEIRPESLDIGLYLMQIIDEFSAAFAEKELTTQLDTPEEAVNVECDSTILWRVFENLLSNIQKYAMPGTRVYFSVTAQNGKAVIEIKNISAEQITLSPEELVMRFKRNDQSRSADGNGLGLSIVKSFTEVQNGTFDVEIDGDLFKTVITFPLAKA